MFLYICPVSGDTDGTKQKGLLASCEKISTNMGLSKPYLEKQGLVSIRTVWIQIRYQAKAS
jgi:hypothetical protein